MSSPETNFPRSTETVAHLFKPNSISIEELNILCRTILSINRWSFAPLEFLQQLFCYYVNSNIIIIIIKRKGTQKAYSLY